MNSFNDLWTAIIPLRQGSKGLPGKNVRLLAGKPLYRHAVDMALAAGARQVLISTDIKAILHADLPAQVKVIQRPSALCGDDVAMKEVLLHILQTCEVKGPVVLLQATSPLRQVQDIHAALKQLATGQYGLVFSVTQADKSVLKWGQVEQGRFVPLASSTYCFANRQQLPEVVKPNGAVYAMQAYDFLAQQDWPVSAMGVVNMPAERSHDIDTIDDFELCEKKWYEAFSN